MGINGAKRLSAAISWLEISTEIYPQDAALLTTLGEFYERSGQSALAVESYEKALAIDPNSEKAKAALKKQGQ